MKKRTKRIVAMLLAFAIILQQDSMAGVTVNRLASADEMEEALEPEIIEEDVPADSGTDVVVENSAETDAAQEADSGTDAAEESPAEPQITVDEIEAVEQAETPLTEEESAVSALKLDNSVQTAADAQVSPIALKLTRPDGFPENATWKMETLKVGEIASLTVGTAMGQAEGLALRFSVEADGKICDLTGTTAILDGLDASFLMGGHLSLCRDVNVAGESKESVDSGELGDSDVSAASGMSDADKWEELAVQFSQNGGVVRAHFSVNSDGVLFFWKDADVEAEEADGESMEAWTETGSETAAEAEQETETKSETETEEGTDTEQDIELETEAETDIEQGSEPETEAGAVPGSESVWNESETELESETGAESETETETETEIGELAYDLANLSSDGLMQIAEAEITEAETVYEIYYVKDKELVFQTNSEPDPEKGELVKDVDYFVYNDDGSGTKDKAEDWLFSEHKNDITSVTFREDVPLQSLQCIFYNYTKLEKVNAEKFTATKAVISSMAHAFRGCGLLTSLDLNNWNMSTVTNIGYMFRECKLLSDLKIDNWDTSNVENFNQTFRDCISLEAIDVRGWDVSNATNLCQTFYGCKALTELDLSNWDTTRVWSGNTDQLFNGCVALSQLKLGKNFIFKTLSNKSPCLPSGSWEDESTGKVYSADDIMNNAAQSELPATFHKLISITFNVNGGSSSNSNIESYIGAKLTAEELDRIPTPTRAGYEFAGWWTDPADGEGEQLTAEGTITQTDYYAHWKEYKVYEIFYKDTGELVFQDTNKVDSTKVNPADTDKYIIYDDDGSKASGSGASEASWAFHEIRSQIKSVEFRDNVKLRTLQFIFKGCSELLTVETTNYNAAGVTSIAQAFWGCTKLQTLNLSNWNVSSVENMGYLVRDCKNLQSLDVNGWKTSSATNLNSMFRGCTALMTLNVSNWDTSNVTNMENMFFDCVKLTELNISRWDTSNVANMRNMFYNCEKLTELDMSSGRTKSNVNPSGMFYNCSALCQLKLNAVFVATQETNLTGQWKGLASGKEYDAKSLLASTDKASDTYVRAVPISFHGNGGTPDQTKVDGFVGFALGDKWDSVTEPAYAGFVFNGWWTAAEDGEQLTAETPLTQTDYYAHWKKDRVYEILYESGELVFQSDNTPDPEKGEVRQIFEDDGSNAANSKWEFDEMRDLITSVSFRDNVKLKSLQAIFKDCRNLSTVDVGHYDATGVTTIAYAFSGCESLTSLNLNTWNVSSVTYIGYAFQNCKNLRSLEIDRWETSNVWNMYNTFNGCSSLEKLDVSAWDTAKVSNMIGTFGNCSSLTELNLSGWNTSSVTAESNMANLFAGCTSLYQLSLGADFHFFTNAGLDGQWKRGDDGEVYSGSELMNRYNGSMADTYHRYVRVSFNGNGGIASPQSIECYLGETVDALPTAEWEGYHFRGWFTERNGGEQLGENEPLTQAIYYAHWEPYTYTLRLNAMNGDKEYDTKEVSLTFDAFYQLSENEFTYEGKFLLGWNTKRDGSGEMYGPNSRISGLADQDGSTVNLYAIWGDPDDYVTLTFDSRFDSEDEGLEVSSMRFKKGETVEAKHLPQSTREGYRFEGWSYEENGEPISDKDRVEMSEDRTLYAVWEKYLTVTFDPQKYDSDLQLVKVQAVADEPLEGSLPDFPQREDGSILIGWFAEDDTQVKAGETSVTADTTFYAHWGWRPQFDTAGGKFEGTPEIPFEETSSYTLGVLPEVVRDGYAFDGWYYVDGAEEEKKISAGETVVLGKNTRIVAHWRPDQKVKITLDPGEGTIDGKDGERILNAYQGKAIGDLPVPKREGYIFLGWQDGSGKLYNLTDSFSEDETLTAEWAKELTVTFMDGGKTVATLTVPEGGTIPSLPGVKVDPADTTRNDKILEGWYTTEDNSGTKLTTETTISENVTYYAHWIEFKKNGTAGAGATPYTYGIEWNSASNENVDNVDGHLVFHPTDYRPQTAQLHVHFQLNVGTQEGGSTIPAGGVKIKIPKSVWKGWDGKLIPSGNVAESLSGAKGDAQFAISEKESDEEYYVLVNSSEISGGAGMDATFSYDVDPNQVPGGGVDAAGNYVTKDLKYYHDTFTVTITVDTDLTDGAVDNTHTEDLFIEMHTRVRTFASKEFVKMYPSYSNSWKDTWGSKPADADDYFYIEWKLKETSETTTNQPFTFSWSEENTVHDGTVVGYLNNDGTKVNATGHEIFDKQRVLVKYPRTMLAEAKGGKLPIHNEAIVTEKWDSGYKTSHRVSADYTLEVPEYSGGGRGLDKISFDVANSRNISRPAQKHGGQEDILIDENEVPLGWRVSYSGGAQTQPVWDSTTETYTRSERTISITDGMEKSLLYSSGSADDKYSWNPSKGNVDLSDEDYRFTSVKVNLREYDMVSYGDAWSEMAEHENIADYEDVYLYVRYKDSDEPVFFARVGINVPVSLPENVCGIEIRHDSSFYWTDITVDLGVNLQPSPAVSRLFKEDVGRDTTSIVKNRARCQVWASGQTDPYVNVTSDNESSAVQEVWEMDISDTSQFLQKRATTLAGNVILDVKHGTQDSPMSLTGWLYNNGGRIQQMRTGVFYDLLPLGTTVDPETVYGIWTDTNWSSVGAPGYPANNYKSNQNSERRLPSAYIDVKFESNWESSQRTMMIIEFALPEGVKANGVQIYYLLRTTYENIMENGATQQNSVAFVNTTELSATPKLTQSGIEILSQDEKYFKSLDTKYSGRISYSEDSENYIPVDVSTWGFDKQVKAETGSSYVQKDHVLLNDTYTYRLIYSQGSGTHTKDIVFLDVLENGYYEKDPTSETGKKLIGAEWKGTFENINVESIRKLTMIDDGKTLRCNPVVYYSTVDRNMIEGAELNLSDTTVWTTDPPDNKKDITAVAVDCSKCEDGKTKFELKGNVDAMEIYITMRAPTDAKLVDQTTRNRAVINMKHVDSERSETAVMMDAGASVVLKDVTPELHKSSDPGSGTEDNPASVYQDDQLTYTLSVKNTGEEIWLDDIVLEDTIPSGLSVQNSNIRVRFGADVFTAIEGVPRVKLSRVEQTLTFRIGMLYPGETVEIAITGTVTAATGTLTNTAKIVSVNDVEKTVHSETTYHEVTPIGFNISKTGVGGKPLAGATLQLWKLNEGVKAGAELNGTNYTKIAEWESDGKVKTFTEQTSGIYVLHEVYAPAGHLKAEDITMELDSRGNLTLDGKFVPSVTMKDEYTKVSIVKEDHTGHAVKGARLAVYELENFDTTTGEPISGSESVAEWETDGRPHELDGVLDAGKKYILYEAEAPEGYRRAKYVEFEVPSDGSHCTVFMYDPFDSFEVKIRKVDPDGNSLAGAKLRIMGKKNGEEEEISPIEWDTTVEDYTIKLYPGTYTLSEVFAPDGYAVADPIAFKVEEDSTNNAKVTVNGEAVKELTLVMEDKWAQDLTVTKTVRGEEPEDSGEKKEYSFTLTLKKADGNLFTEPLAYKKREKSIEGGPNMVTSGMISATEEGVYPFNLAGDENFTFVDVPQGLTYVVDEISETDAGYVVTKENDKGTTNGYTATAVNITNTYPEMGDLLISKTVIGSWAPPGEIYTVQITPESGKTIHDGSSPSDIHVYKMSSDGKEEMAEPDAVITENDITVKLAGGEQIVVHGLKQETYKVTEIGANWGTEGAAFTTKYKVNGGDESEAAEVAVAADTIGNVEVRNTYPDVGELTIEKTVSGGIAPDDDTWYTVQVSCTTAGAFENYQIESVPANSYQNASVIRGGLRFQLRKDSKVTISGLSVGTYMVKESVAGLDCIASYTVNRDSKTSETGGSVTLSRGTGTSAMVSSGEVQIDNRYPDSTSMRLFGTKAVIGKELEAGRYHFGIEAVENPGGGAVLPTSVTVANSGVSGDRFGFDAITFVKAGTYVFRVMETSSDDPEVAKDGTVYTVTVTVETIKNDTTYAYEITKVVIARIAAGGGETETVATYEQSFDEETEGSGGSSGSEGSGGSASEGDLLIADEEVKPIPEGNAFNLPEQDAEDGTGKAVKATFINRAKHPLEMPDTGGSGAAPITRTSILLCLAGCFILLLAKRRKENQQFLAAKDSKRFKVSKKESE